MPKFCRVNHGKSDKQGVVLDRWTLDMRLTEVPIPAVPSLDMWRICEDLRSKFAFAPQSVAKLGPRLPQVDSGNLAKCSATGRSSQARLVRDFMAFVRAFDQDGPGAASALIRSRTTFALHQILFLFDNAACSFLMFELVSPGHYGLFFAHNGQGEVFLVSICEQIRGFDQSIKKYSLDVYPCGDLRHFNAGPLDTLFLRNMPLHH